MLHLNKIENGAQLLARLGPRLSIHELASVLPGLETRAGTLVELWGGEGVGKTELLLHLATSLVCSAPSMQLSSGPCDSSDGSLGSSNTNRAQVLWIDCDFKFPVLRLAVLLEQQVLAAYKKHNKSSCSESFCAGTDKAEAEGHHLDVIKAAEESRTQRDCVEVHNPDTMIVTMPLRHKRKAEELEKGDANLQTHDEETRRKVNHSKSNYETGKWPRVDDDTTCSYRHTNGGCRQTQAGATFLNTSAGGLIGDAKTGHRAVEYKGIVSTSGLVEQRHTVHEAQCQDVNEQEVEKCQDVNEQEVERRVQECLQCVQVMQCTSSQQLVVTLYSLESVIAMNPNIALLVVDPISAFFWSDRCSDLNSAYLHKNMTNIADVLTRLATTYGLLVVVTKQALIRPKAREKENKSTSAESMPSPNTSVLGNLSSRTALDSHVEFLGRNWAKAVTQRYICTNSVRCESGDRKMQYKLTGPSGSRKFTIGENGICFHSS